MFIFWRLNAVGMCVHWHRYVRTIPLCLDSQNMGNWDITKMEWLHTLVVFCCEGVQIVAYACVVIVTEIQLHFTWFDCFFHADKLIWREFPFKQPTSSSEIHDMVNRMKVICIDDIALSTNPSNWQWFFGMCHLHWLDTMWLWRARRLINTNTTTRTIHRLLAICV